MPDKSPDKTKIPDDPDGRALGKARAAARVAAALRENLKRRKAQERALAAAGTIDMPTEQTGAAGASEPD